MADAATDMHFQDNTHVSAALMAHPPEFVFEKKKKLNGSDTRGGGLGRRIGGSVDRTPRDVMIKLGANRLRLFAGGTRAVKHLALVRRWAAWVHASDGSVSAGAWIRCDRSRAGCYERPTWICLASFFCFVGVVEWDACRKKLSARTP